MLWFRFINQNVSPLFASAGFSHLQYSIEGSEAPRLCRTSGPDVADVDAPVQQTIRNTETEVLQIRRLLQRQLQTDVTRSAHKKQIHVRHLKGLRAHLVEFHRVLVQDLIHFLPHLPHGEGSALGVRG